MLTRKQLSLIHVAKNQIDLSDEDYRAILKNFKVSSSKDLAPWYFKELMDLFKKLGFKQLTGDLSQGQYKKIKVMSNILGWNRTRINGFVRRQLGIQKPLETLSRKEANKIIEGLKNLSAIKG